MNENFLDRKTTELTLIKKHMYERGEGWSKNVCFQRRGEENNDWRIGGFLLEAKVMHSECDYHFPAIITAVSRYNT